DDMDLMVRTVMRYPSTEARQLLENLHERISLYLQAQSLTALTWLISPFSKRAARGGFDHAETLQNFLEKDPKTISSSRLITGLETILTAISYQIVNPFPVIQSDQEAEIYELCIACMAAMHPRIDSYYPDKYNTRYAEKETDVLSSDEFYGRRRRSISICSEDEDVSISSSVFEQLPEKVFCKKKVSSLLSTDTWVEVARRSNIPIRDSVSGSCGLVLTAAKHLFGYSQANSFREEAEILTGVMCIPAYERDDWHTIAETAAGLHYYLMIDSKECEQNPSVISPKAAMEYGLQLLKMVVHEKFKSDIELLAQQTLSLVTYENYTSQKTVPYKYRVISDPDEE
ncbi:MAG: hypothetical protein HY324_02310, partial [Chlamydiia bacterium]|nr:hypothetical protein [Chlamydiia bacterium]